MDDLDLLSSFAAASKAQWMQQVRNDLKGKPVESLNRRMPDGFETGPFYTAEDLDQHVLARDQLPPGRLPGWLTVPEVVFHSETVTNTVLRAELAKGADGLLLTIHPANRHEIDWKRLLNGLKLSDTPVWFRLDNQSAELTKALTEFLPYQLKGGLIDDSINRFFQTRTVSGDALNQLAQATQQTLDSPQFRTLTVESHSFHNAGATATQELAFVLGALVDVYDFLTETGLSLEQLIPKTALSISVGTDYFTEIAKLRAFRMLWQRLLTFYQTPAIGHQPPFIHAQTSTFYDSTATPYTNLLRATTEAMAAVIGGCDALTVHPYDAVFADPDEFSRRIARNVSILLKEEAYLDKTIDPAAGSYYLETLTAQLTESAWKLFLEVEQMGGLRNAFSHGFVQNEIEKAYGAKVEAIQNGRVLVGVTKFRTEAEATPVSRDLPKTATVLPSRRLAQAFE
ncbi:hypothetical protein GCM10027347_28410 [Larkinella harenae]